MRHVLDLPEEEVARTLGISLGTVKSQTSKGLAQLRSQLDPGDLAAAAGVRGTPERPGRRRDPCPRMNCSTLCVV